MIKLNLFHASRKFHFTKNNMIYKHESTIPKYLLVSEI